MDNLNGYETDLGDEELGGRARYGVCAECDQKAQYRLMYFGIGSYEFWGATGNHVEWAWASECCEAEEQEKEQAQTAAERVEWDKHLDDNGE